MFLEKVDDLIGGNTQARGVVGRLRLLVNGHPETYLNRLSCLNAEQTIQLIHTVQDDN